MVAGDRPAWLAQELYPFESHYVDVAGARVHYLDEGSGPPLLMLHGNPTWSFLYRDLIKGLRDRYRCIAPDYPGFGLSRAPVRYGYRPAEHAGVIERLILELDLTGVTTMVQDWGGPIGFAAATRHADRILASRPFLAELQRALPAVTDRPALLVWPTKDPVFGDRERERWEELFPNHQTVLLKGANHYIQEDSPAEIVTAIRDWSAG